MGFIDSGSKSSRLLASRRYTHNTHTTAQESFTKVIDIQSAEIYTEANLVPTSSLPFSGSSQVGVTYSTVGTNVMKYWYRHKLTPSNVNDEVWFFLNPTGSDSGIGAQLIDSNQQTSFISPKYSIASLANSTAEDSTPGYGVVAYKSSTYTQTSQTGSLSSGDKISGNDYIFDYKTGVLQFLSSAHDPASNEVVFLTAYQYVGKTLDEGISFTGDTTLISVSSSMIPNADDAFDIGTTTKQWKDLFVDGTANIDTLSLTDAFTYNGVTFNTSGSTHLSLTGSSFDFKSTNSSNLLTLYNSSDEVVFKFDDKVLTLGASTTTPTARAGGLFYSGSDQWFLGFDGVGLP